LLGSQQEESSGRRQRGRAGAGTSGETLDGLPSACCPPSGDTGDSGWLEGVSASAAQM